MENASKSPVAGPTDIEKGEYAWLFN